MEFFVSNWELIQTLFLTIGGLLVANHKRRISQMKINKNNGQRILSKSNPKPVSPFYKDGKAMLDEKPHELVLASFGEPDLQERVDDMTRLSRVRRIRPNDRLV